MKTLYPASRENVSHVIGELLMLFLFLVSLIQIGLCLSATSLLTQPASPYPAPLAGVVARTNAPAVDPAAGGVTGATSFPSGAKHS